VSAFDPRGKVNRALLVGVSEYDHTKAREPDGVPGQLPAVLENRVQLGEALQRSGVFDEGQIAVRASLSQDEFGDALHGAAREAQGLLLFYFAGHGIVPSAGDELFLQMRNARIVAGGHDAFPGAVAFTEVLAVLAGSRAERVVVILDCCYSGNAAGVWQRFGHVASQRQQKVMLLMSVQPNRLIGAGSAGRPTPFTRELVALLREGGHVTLAGLYTQLCRRMAAAGYRTASGDRQSPQAAWELNTDVLLVAKPLELTDERPSLAARLAQALGRLLRGAATAAVTAGRAVRGALRGSVAGGLGALGRLLRIALVLLLPLALIAGGGYLLVSLTGDDGTPCAPPLELRVLTDPDLEPTVRAAAAGYLLSPDNTTADGCRRSGITVYSAGAADVVAALRTRTDTWQEPQDDDNPQRDVGPQPDVWIPATRADVDRVTDGQGGRVAARLEAIGGPLAYSPLVLALPQNLAGRGAAERTGRPLTRLIDDLKRRDGRADVRRPDPEYTGTALLATTGLYAGAADARAAEQRLAQPGPPAPASADLLCTLPDVDAVDNRTAALVPEFLLKSGVGCDSATRAPRSAAYPDDVPGLEPAFVRVHWEDAGRDPAARKDAADRFHAWLAGTGGRTVFGEAGFRSATGARAPISPEPVTGVLPDPGDPPAAAGGAALARALAGYRGANGPGRVLFLLDSSGSMGALWEGPSGGPGILEQSLRGLGPQDEYGVWAVHGTTEDRHTELLPFGRHKAGDAQKVLGDSDRTRVYDAEADPGAALLDALDDMAGRGTDDDRPQLIVHLTDDEDNNRLTGRRLDQVLDRAAQAGVPVAVVSLSSGGCDQGRPDARISQASGGRCLDASDDLGAGLHDEVARTGTGEE
jgi:hypothetical protein